MARSVGRQVGDADRVQLERLGREMLHRVDVDLTYLGCWTVAATVCVASLSQYASAGQHLLVRHPHDRSLELVGDLGRIVGDRDARRRANSRSRRRASASPTDRRQPGRDRRHRDDPRVPWRSCHEGTHPHRVAWPDRTAGDQPRKAAEIEIGPIDPLDRHAERLGLFGGRRRASTLSRCADQRRSVIPWRVGADKVVILSPLNPEIGIAVKSLDTDADRESADSPRRSSS